MFVLLLVTQSSGVTCSVCPSSQGGTEARVLLLDPVPPVARCKASVGVGVARSGSSFVTGPFLLKELKHSSYGFHVLFLCLSLSLFPRWRFHPFVASAARFSSRVL